MAVTGLVLEGGGMRGVYTTGVLDSFLDNNIEFDNCIGVSAGACNACSYLAKQKGRGFAVFTDYLEEKEYCSMNNLIKTGDLFGEEFVYHTIPEKLYPIDNETFKKGKTSFYAVVTNCVTGKAEYIKINDLQDDVDVVRASSSLPLLAREVMINATPYLDGGIADSIPAKKAISMGCEKNVVILTREKEYQKKADMSASIIGLKYRKYPELVKRIKQRHLNYNRCTKYLEELEKENKVMIIQPEKSLGVGRVEKNKEKLKEAYDIGYQQGMSMAEKIKEYLK